MTFASYCVPLFKLTWKINTGGRIGEGETREGNADGVVGHHGDFGEMEVQDRTLNLCFHLRSHVVSKLF